MIKGMSCLGGNKKHSPLNPLINRIFDLYFTSPSVI